MPASSPPLTASPAPPPDAPEGAAFFVTGGTVPVTSASYIPRRADRDLLQGLLDGEFCYVLNARQMGKSSLSVRTMAALSARGVRTVFLDLTRIGGQNVTPEQWYMGLLQATGRVLGLRAEMVAYWKASSDRSFPERFFGALRDVALETLAPSPDSQPALVIFIDEIDASRSLSFTVDEFFAAIRAFYNARVLDPIYGRLAFCLVGSALPSELIHDPRVSPFNIGRRIELRDFTWEEVQPMARGLSGVAHAEALLRRVFYWTNGHPYLTQSLCAEIASMPTGFRKPGDVDALVARLFFDVRARSRNVNLADVSNRLLRLSETRGDDARAAALTLYRKVWEEKRSQTVLDDETDPMVGVLKLSGIVRSEAGRLRVRCRLYARVFDAGWINEGMPDAELRRQRAAFRRGVLRTSLIAGGVFVVMAALSIFAVTNAVNARRNAVSARQNAETNRRNLYDAEIDQANSALASGELRRAREILDELKPRPGETDLREFTWGMLDRRAHDQSAAVFAAVGSPVCALALSRDGRYLAAADLEKQVHIWDVQNKTLLSQFSVSPTSAQSLAFTPDNRSLLTVSATNETEAQVWDWRSGTLRTPTLPVNPLSLGTGTAPAFSPDGKSLVWAQAVSADGKRPGPGLADDRGPIELRRAQDFALLKRIDGIGRANAVTFTGDGRTLIVGRANGVVQTYSTAPPYAQVGTPIVVPDTGFNNGVKLQSISLSSDGRTLATGGGAGGEVRLWDLAARRQIGTLAESDRTTSQIAFTPDGRTLIAAGYDGTVRVWDVASRTADVVWYGHQASVEDLVVTRDGRSALTISLDGMIRQWDVTAARRHVPGETLSAAGGGVAPPGLHRVVEKDVFARSMDQTLTAERIPGKADAVRVEDVVSGQTIVLRDAGMRFAPVDVARPQFTPEGRWLWAVSGPVPKRRASQPSGTGWILKRWDWRRGRADRTVSLPSILPEPNALLIDAQGNIVVYADPAKVLHWLDALTGREVVSPISLPRRPSEFFSRSVFEIWQNVPDTHADIQFRLPGKGREPGTIEVWMLMPDRRHLGHYTQNDTTNEGNWYQIDPVMGISAHMFRLPIDQGSCAVLTEGGTIIVAQPGGLKRVLRYDLTQTTGKPLTPFVAHAVPPSMLRNVSVTQADGSVQSLVFSMSLDGDVHVNDPYTGALLADLRGHQQIVRDADLSPDGRTAATISDDRTLALWDLRTQRRMASIPLSFYPLKVRFSHRAPLLIVTDQHQDQLILRGEAEPPETEKTPTASSAP